MIVKPSIRYLNRAPDAVIIHIVGTALAAIGANPHVFAAPSPSLLTIKAALDAFIAALQEAALGGPAQTAIKNGCRQQLVSLMRLLSNYVGEIAGRDIAILLLSGLPHHKPTRSKIGRLPRPLVPLVKKGPLSGSLVAATAPIYGAHSYNWRVALASAHDIYVNTAQTTGGRVRFDGLIPGEVYNVEANVVGAAGASDWSDAGSTRIV